MKKNIVPFAARMPAFIFILGEFWGEYLSGQEGSFRYFMWPIILLSFVLAERLIYQTGGAQSEAAVLRKNGYLWFFVLYAPILILGAIYDIYILAVRANEWMGIPLFLLKILAIAFLGIQLSKMEKGSWTAGEKNLPILVLFGTLTVLLIFQHYVTGSLILQWMIEILILVALGFLLFHPSLQ